MRTCHSDEGDCDLAVTDNMLGELHLEILEDDNAWGHKEYVVTDEVNSPKWRVIKSFKGSPVDGETEKAPGWKHAEVTVPDVKVCVWGRRGLPAG